MLLQNRAVAHRSRHHARARRDATPVLPLGRSDRKIAVIGYDAGPGTQIEEGGSPAVKPGGPVITPLAGIRARAPKRHQRQLRAGHARRGAAADRARRAC